MSTRFYTGFGRTEPFYKIAERHGAFSFNDVLLAPASSSNVHSRTEISLATKFGPFSLKAPIISAPMDTVSGINMCRALWEEGCIGTMPREPLFSEDHILRLKTLIYDNIPFVLAVSSGVTMSELDTYAEAGVKAVLIDVAHGANKDVLWKANIVSKQYDFFTLVGNIATYEAATAYKNIGLNWARVGIGNGSACQTRVMSGTGVPQLYAVMEAHSAGVKVIADGGIKEPAHAAYCLAGGASMVMLGSALASTVESPGYTRNVFDENSCKMRRYKTFRGQASSAYMEDHGIEENEFRTAEGIETEIEITGTVKSVIDRYKAGIRSAMSYAGARNLEEFYEQSRFIFTTTHTRGENIPHVLS